MVIQFLVVIVPFDLFMTYYALYTLKNCIRYPSAVYCTFNVIYAFKWKIKHQSTLWSYLRASENLARTYERLLQRN